MLSILKGSLALGLVGLSTVVHVGLLMLLALLKLLLPLPALRRLLSRGLIVLAESWIAFNSRMIALFTRTRFEVEGLEGLQRDGWYLVLSNHQSWVDIPVLQKVFNRRIPFLKFFLKRQLIWVPLLGLAWWALDFPFMARHSKSTLEKRPELRGQDMAATRRACERFRELPVSVMNFVEGTRYTPAKHQRQQSPFAHLLKPKAGGVAFVLGAMDGLLRAVVDVAIVYPGGTPNMWQLFSDQVPVVRVRVIRREIPADMIGDYENDRAFRVRFQAWLNTLWLEKDAAIAEMLAR